LLFIFLNDIIFPLNLLSNKSYFNIVRFYSFFVFYVFVLFIESQFNPTVFEFKVTFWKYFLGISM
jgi:hypothetical protein